ncbi:MAG: hypothetical protein P4L76_17830 [Beijerinckiaceae bacterium]|nr:hypothetical protein [Beijerinckiaceae bacterium]
MSTRVNRIAERIYDLMMKRGGASTRAELRARRADAKEYALAIDEMLDAEEREKAEPPELDAGVPVA